MIHTKEQGIGNRDTIYYLRLLLRYYPYTPRCTNASTFEEMSTLVFPPAAFILCTWVHISRHVFGGHSKRSVNLPLKINVMCIVVVLSWTNPLAENIWIYEFMNLDGNEVFPTNHQCLNWKGKCLSIFWEEVKNFMSSPHTGNNLSFYFWHNHKIIIYCNQSFIQKEKQRKKIVMINYLTGENNRTYIQSITEVKKCSAFEVEVFFHH